MNALRSEAQAAGAVFSYGAQVREIVRGQAQVRVLLDTGEVISCERVVVAAGAYAQTLLPELARVGSRGQLHALRCMLAWTMPAAEQRAALGDMPVWAAFTPGGFFYGFPFGNEGVEGFKLACHVAGEQGGVATRVDPERVDREARATDLEPIDGFLQRYIPGARGPVVRTSVCMYGQSDDGDFVIDLHPEDPRVCVCAGFSGHGFKFAPTIGFSVADLLERGSSPWQLPRFKLGTN